MNREDTHDMNVVKKALKDAGMFEENMDERVMIEYYNAIRNSESTACEESEVRQIELSESNIGPDPSNEERLQLEESDDELLGKMLAPKEVIKAPKEAVKNTKAGRSTKETIGFNDMPVLSEKLLDIVHHEPKYFLAVNFTSEKFKRLSLKDRVNLLFRYHTNISQTIAGFARQSMYPTPRPSKDIQPSYKFSGTLFRGINADHDDIFDFNTDAGIYTSRSGRQVKRKKYTEDLDFEGDLLQNKKTKNSEEDEWVSKKSKVSDKKNTHSTDEFKTTKKEKSETIQAPAEITIQENSVSSTPVAKYDSLKRLSNEQIMKRCSLFSPLTGRKTRSEALFDKVKEETEKKKVREKEMEAFEKSLNNVELDISEIDEIRKDDDESFISKRRPIARRSINIRKRIPQEESEVQVTESAKKFAKSTAKPITGIQNGNVGTDKKATISESDEKKINCPLCNIPFSEDEIQEHAATCCEPSDISPPSLRSSTLRRTCEHCDKVLPLDTNYEAHTQQCLKSQTKLKRK